MKLVLDAFDWKNEFTTMDENEYGKIWIVVFKGNALIDCSVLNY